MKALLAALIEVHGGEFEALPGRTVRSGHWAMDPGSRRSMP